MNYEQSKLVVELLKLLYRILVIQCSILVPVAGCREHFLASVALSRTC
jgi:hypothetical protein